MIDYQIINFLHDYNNKLIRQKDGHKVFVHIMYEIQNI